ncbi:hypothetical protein P7K49_031382 [Saguinus oedipus]|uniref:Uncharacterized protein n=1 Tax=Saguinus oedipus TaxID=9490 RepID=A0ABQ9TZY3_SAGOE|nr:hypothetical protein P7K49_031382 [Saguinus oedipus]
MLLYLKMRVEQRAGLKIKAMEVPPVKTRGGEVRRALDKRKNGEGPAQGLAGALTDTDVPQLFRPQIHVLENRGHDSREKLVGGGVLQREEQLR